MTDFQKFVNQELDRAMQHMDSEQLRQVAIEHDELVRITLHYLGEHFPQKTYSELEALARGLLAKYSKRNYIWKKVTQ